MGTAVQRDSSDSHNRTLEAELASSWAAVARSGSLSITVTATGTEAEAIRLRAYPT